MFALLTLTVFHIFQFCRRTENSKMIQFCIIMCLQDSQLTEHFSNIKSVNAKCVTVYIIIYT